MSEQPSKTLREQAKEKGLKYLQDGGDPERIQDIKKDVMKDIDASETTVYYGLRDAVAEYEKAVIRPVKPEVTVIEEPVTTPITEIKAEPPPPTTEPLPTPPIETPSTLRK